MTEPIDRYAVFGNPIAHSKSPQIHQAFAKQTAQHIVYERILAPLDGFAQCLQDFFAAGGCGANVTVPFKLQAVQVAQQCTARARLAGAANTLFFRDGMCWADNTDGVGLVRDLTKILMHHAQKDSLAGQRILLLGAGGAARGVLQPLLEQLPASLTIANRTVSKAQALLALQPLSSAQLHACGFAELAGHTFDLVINATASSLQDEIPPLPAHVYAPQALAYDMMYGATPTPFMRAAQAEGAAYVSDGLGMLVEQAAEAFYLWRGVRPDTAAVLAGLRAEMQTK